MNVTKFDVKQGISHSIPQQSKWVVSSVVYTSSVVYYTVV